MIICLDTTETFDNLRMSGTSFEVLHRFLIKTHSKLIVPRLVVDETVNHFRERLHEAQSKAMKELKALRRVLDSANHGVLPVIDEAAEVAAFAKALENRILILGGSIIGHDQVVLDSVLSRALRRQKPFDPNGRTGFRDAVIWESLLQYVTALSDIQADIVFITKNKKDFCDGGNLAWSLQSDLTARSKPSDCIRVVGGLWKFIEEEVTPSLELLTAILDCMRAGDYPGFVLQTFFKQHHSRIFEALANYSSQINLSHLSYQLRGYFSPSLYSMNPVPDCGEVVEVLRLDDKRLVVNVHAVFASAVRCRRIDDAPEPSMTWLDDEYNPHSVELAFSLSLSLIVNEATGEVSEFEVEDIEVYFDSDSESESESW